MVSLDSVNSAKAFDVEVRPDRERVFVVPVGELDLDTVGSVAAEIDALVRVGFEQLVLDLRELTFLDAAGLRLVIAQARRTDVQVQLINGPRPVARVFEIAEVAPSLPFQQP